MFKKLLPIFGFIFISVIFFWQFFFKGLVPISSDTVVGLYHPYRDFYAKEFPRGYPFKNFLITDPVRQQYPWRTQSLISFENGKLPTWNSYAFSGTPGLANFQSAAFYPFNILFFFLPYIYSWSILIFLQPLLAGIFLYFYLRNLKLDGYSSFFGGIVFAFSGFFVTWLEWGTVLSTALWLPLVLLSIDKIFEHKKDKRIIWPILLFISLAFAIFGGHLQTLFYLFIFSFVYFLCRLWQSKKKIQFSFSVGVSIISALIIGSIQLVPTFKFIQLSGRGMDMILWKEEGWFLPFRHMIQFVSPDFFGNPTTLNYWGAWNYGELTAYAGITTLMFGLVAILFRRDKKTWLYLSAIIFCLMLILPSPISKLPFILNLPFISTSQPTRLIFVIDFSLSVLGALGLNYLIVKGKIKNVVIPVAFICLILLFLVAFAVLGGRFGIDPINLMIAKRNLILPIGIFAFSSIAVICFLLLPKKFKSVFLILLIFITVADLFRFSGKFNTFSNKEFLYPQTKSTEFMRNNLGLYRIGTADARLMAPNFQIMHGLYSVEGYDPLYIGRYAEFIAAINRNKPDIAPPFGFNRIIRVENYSSPLINLLGIKFVMSMTDMNNPGFEKVFEEGETKIYQNNNVLPKAYFVENIFFANSKQEVINKMFAKNFKPMSTAVVENKINEKFEVGSVEILRYSSDEVVLRTTNNGEGFLVLTDSYYPTWHVMIDNQKSRIYQTNYIFRGVVVPSGEHKITFENNLL